MSNNNYHKQKMFTLDDLDSDIENELHQSLFEFIRNTSKTTKGYKYHETCDRTVTHLLSRYDYIDGVREWLDALKDTIWIAGTSPSFVIGKLNSKCTPFKYNNHAKVVETYINFYFYFFENTDVTNDSMKIASWLDKHLKIDEYNKIISRFPDDEKECLSNSLLKYNRINNSIKKCYVYFDNDICGIKWSLKSNDGIEIHSGISSNTSWAKLDARRCANDFIEIDPSCEFIFVDAK